MVVSTGDGLEKLEDMIVRAAETTAATARAARAAIGTVIFGQEIMAKSGVHAALFTTTGTLKSWNNFFVTKGNVATLAKSLFWDVGSQGLGLLPINENMPKVTSGFF